MSQRSSALSLFRNAFLKPFFWSALDFLCLGIVDGEGGGAAVVDAGAAEPGATETTDSTAEPTLRESLEANMELAEKGEESSDLSAAAKRLAAARKGRDPKSAAKPADAKTVETEAKKDAKPAEAKTEETAVDAPAHWPAADREMFAKQSPEAKQWLINRHKAMEADYTRKTQEVVGMRKFKEELDDIFKDYRDEMALNGVTDAMAIRQLVAAHTLLRKDPASAMKRLAEQYGIDLKGITEGAAAADPAGESPTVKALRDEVKQLTGQLRTLTGAQDQHQQKARLDEVTHFAEEKDAQGQLMRPYFDDVAKDVAALIQVARTNGERLTLQDAYDRAVYANPTIRAKVLAASDAQRRAKEEAERKAKAEAARKAGFDIKGEGAAAAGVATNSSLRDSLERAWDAQEGRV